MASTDARPLPRKNVAFRHYFALRTNAGALVTTWAGMDSEVSLDGAAFADATAEATEIGTSGCGYLDLTAAEMNADAVLLKVTVTNTDALPYVVTFFPEEAGDIRADAVKLGGSDVTTTGAVNFYGDVASPTNITAATGVVLSGVTHTGAVIPTVTTVGTLTTYTGNTPQTGDSFARLGSPAGASVSADVAAVKADSAAILTDTGTTLDGKIDAVPQATVDAFYADPRFVDGTAAAGSATTITLQTGSPAIDYAGQEIEIVSGTGAGQVAAIVSNVGLVCTVETNGVAGWATTAPDATSKYVFNGLAPSAPTAAEVATAVEGLDALRAYDALCRAGSTNTVFILAADAPSESIVGQQVRITVGPAAGYAGRVTAYDTGTKAATVTPAATATPTTSSGYVLSGIAGDKLAADGLSSVTVGVLAADVLLRKMGAVLLGAESAPSATTRGYAQAGAPGTAEVVGTVNAVTGIRTAVNLEP